MKISIDDAIYRVNEGREDERSSTGENASENDVAIMLEALRIAQKKRPKTMVYAKLYKVSFVQLRTGDGKLDGKKTAIPYLVIREYPGGGHEETLQMSENGFSEGACLCLPLTSAHAIASWIVKHLDRHVNGKISALKRDLETWQSVATEVDLWPYTVLAFPNYAVGELPLGRYETIFRDKTDLGKVAQLEIRPYNGALRVKALLGGSPLKHGDMPLNPNRWTILFADSDKLIEEVLYEQLRFE